MTLTEKEIEKGTDCLIKAFRSHRIGNPRGRFQSMLKDTLKGLSVRFEGDEEHQVRDWKL